MLEMSPPHFQVRLGLESSLCAAVRAETFQGYKSLPSKSFRKIRSWFEQNTTSAPTIWWNSGNNTSYALIDHYGKRSILRMCKSKIGGSLNRSDKKNNISCQKGFLRPFPPRICGIFWFILVVLHFWFGHRKCRLTVQWWKSYIGMWFSFPLFWEKVPFPKKSKCNDLKWNLVSKW